MADSLLLISNCVTLGVTIVTGGVTIKFRSEIPTRPVGQVCKICNQSCASRQTNASTSLCGVVLFFSTLCQYAGAHSHGWHPLGQPLFEDDYKYQLIFKETSDSLLNADNIKEIANIEFTYQVEKQARLDSLEQIKAEMIRFELEEKERYLKGRRAALEYIGISLFIIVMFLIVLMNRRLQIYDRMMNLLVFILFLILFEASLVGLDPLIDRISKGEVLLKVLFNSVLAFIVFASHHFLEKRLNSLIRKK